MKKINLFNFILLIAVSAGAEKAPTLDSVRGLIAEKKTAEAVGILQTDSLRLLKTEKDFKDVTQWLSVFLYDESLLVYEKALELAPTDPSGARAQFENLLKAEPYNKIILGTYIGLLIDQKKYKEARVAIDKAAQLFPYFPIFLVYGGYLSLLMEEPATLPACEKKAMTLVEIEFCQLTRLAVKATPVEDKKRPSEQELKSLAAKTSLPDKFYWLWVGTKNESHLKSYVSTCQNMSEKDKKSYRIVPGVCAKILEVESKLQKKKNDETNAP